MGYDSGMPEITKKQRILDALKDLPEETTYEDAIERLLFVAKVEEGLRESRAGHLIAHEEIKKQFGV
jgi:hypothetical protein